MKNFLLIVIFLTPIFQLKAEQIERTINWIVPQNIVRNSGYFVWPDFIGSVKTGREAIPVYSENFKIEKAVSKVQIINPRYSVLDTVPDGINLSEEIGLHYHLFNSGKDRYLQIELVPFVRKGNRIFRLDSFEFEITETGNSIKSTATNNDWQQSSVLSSGKWVKIKTSQQGIYKITYSDLQSCGFADPSSVGVYGGGGYMLPQMNSDSFYDDLQQNAVWHGKDGDDNSCLFFYSTGTVKWSYDASKKMFLHSQNYYSDDTFYYLTDSGNTLLVQAEYKPDADAGTEVDEFDGYMRHENDKENHINSGAVWYGDEHQEGESKSFPFDIPNRIETDTFKLYIESIGRSSYSSQLKVLHGNSLIGTMAYTSLSLDAGSDYGVSASLRKNVILSGATVSLTISYTANSDNSEAWIDFIDVNSRCRLELEESQLMFRDIRSVKEDAVTCYSLASATSGTQVWDVSDYFQPVSIQGELSGTNLKFTVETSELREFVAFNPDGDIPSPEKIEEVENQDLHGATIPELLIITYPDFISQANELAGFHLENDNMAVSVYTTEQVYNEFSSGSPDAAGIRNFIRMCYEKSTDESSLKYVLLLGDGSFDNKDIRGKGYNLIPTYQSEESLSPTGSFVSDDFFVLLDPDEGAATGLIDLGIGRIPARTTSEAEAVVEKIENYVSSEALGKWRNVISFIADDGNSGDGYTNQHMQQSETIADLINQDYPAFYTDKIYFDAYTRETTSGMATYPEVNDAIDERIEGGVLIMNYIGHANEEFLADEQVLDIPMIDSWTNYKNLPIFVTATCEFSRFDEDDLSAGEHILFNANGGGVGLFSTTRLVYSGANFNLTKSFYNHVFEKDAEGNNLRMGDIMRLAKVNSNTGTNKRNFTLLADPALRLAYPQLNVRTETINGQAVEDFTETVSALEKITITGSITDQLGNIKTDFEGTVIPIVYDRANELETLGNAGQSTMEFTVQDNIIYKGNVSISQGVFSFSFVVPKDISYSIDNGKIIYYAQNGETDAHGAFEDFLIGGSSDTSISDDQGPVIKMYMNNESFVSGNKVGPSSLLIAKVSDENGINTVGTGIGHDITAVLDDDNSSVYVLNDYYESDIDSYTSGTIVYTFNDLDPGKHKLTLKVWDVVNNSSEESIVFVVTSDFEISSVICYPTVVTDYAYFYFVHNLPDGLFSATVEVFDCTGKRIDFFEDQISSNGTESVPVKWQPANMLRSGMYLVRFNVASSEGYTSTKTGRFIFMKK